MNVLWVSSFLYRVSIMGFIVNAAPLPVIPLNRMTQIVASRPAPQTQNRGRRRVRLGLLGALIPPAASAPVSACPGLRPCAAAARLHTALLLLYRLDASLAAFSISGIKAVVRPVLSASASRVRSASTPDIPTAPGCRHRSAAGATTITHIDPEYRLLPPVSPSVCARRACFSGVSANTTRERRQLGGASGATGNRGCVEVTDVLVGDHTP